VSGRVTRLAPPLAHVRAAGGSWAAGNDLAPEKKSPPRLEPGGRMGKEPDATSVGRAAGSGSRKRQG
jgi:hypothetical protein